MSSLPASRAASALGSRPTSPYVNRDTLRREKEMLHHQLRQHQQQQQQFEHQPMHSYQPREPQYGYSQI